MGAKIKQMWEYIQDLMDVSGDSIMAVMSAVFILRVVASAWTKFPSITASEAAMYASAIGAFSYSNKGPKS